MCLQTSNHIGNIQIQSVVKDARLKQLSDVIVKNSHKPSVLFKMNYVVSPSSSHNTEASHTQCGEFLNYYIVLNQRWNISGSQLLTSQSSKKNLMRTKPFSTDYAFKIRGSISHIKSLSCPLAIQNIRSCMYPYKSMIVTA